MLLNIYYDFLICKYKYKYIKSPDSFSINFSLKTWINWKSFKWAYEKK